MRLFVASFFPAFFPPSSGGEQRLYHLYRHLSRWHDVTLFSANYSDRSEEFVEHSPSFREYRVPKPRAADGLHWDLYHAGIGDECSAYVVALSSGLDSALRTRFQQLVRYADVVVHESPFTFPLDEGAYADGKPRVYCAYNVEHRLAAQILEGGAGQAAASFIRFLEGLLVDRADLVLAACEEDRIAFASDFGCVSARIGIVPNGFEPRRAGDAAPGAPAPGVCDRFAAFLGSSHPPNVEAGRFICEALAPALPGLEFRIMGSVCERLKEIAPDNVRLLGFVEEAQMRRQLTECAIALNPLFSGSGTNLKMLQYMEAGAPILATPIGARGLDLESVMAIAEPQRFSAELARLLEDPERLRAMGRAARDKAHEAYTWAHIAERYARQLAPLALAATARSRRRILVLNDFPVTARSGGGEVRIFELLRELARDYDVELLCLFDGDEEQVLPIAPFARQRAIPKTSEHRAAERESERRQPVSVRDLLASEWAGRNMRFMAALRSVLPEVSAVIFEHPYLAPLLAEIPRHVPVVYSALNVEQVLKRRLLAGRSDGAAWAERTKALEDALAERANAIVATCEADADTFRGIYPGLEVIAIHNGVTAPLLSPAAYAAPSRNARPRAIFLGSAHPPNVQAARFIAERLAPAVPEVDFHRVGRVCDALGPAALPANVDCHGPVEEDLKRELLRGATIAVNPLAEGGGSSLKVPDFLAAGLPLLSTRTGARGFGLRPGEDYVDCALDDFAGEIRALLADGARRERLARAGRRAARRLRWPVLGARYRRFLRRFLLREHGNAVRVLVVTYRLADPAPGGAESYLNHLLAHLAAPGFPVDVAACDVGTIEDRWHFSARYGPPPEPGWRPAQVRQVWRFPVEPPPPDSFAKCRSLFSLWMEESRRQWIDLFDRIEEPALLGGWNFPEGSAGGAWRWTALRAQVGVVGAFDRIRLDGTSPRAQRVAIRCGEEVLAEAQVEGRFALCASLPAGRRIVEIEVEAAHLAPEDPRELGVSVHGIDLHGPAGTARLDLSIDGEALLRRSATDAWIESLIDLTEDRAAEADDRFFQVRGPDSTALRDWLRQHAGDYDVVLVQGAPFAPLRWASRIAREAGPAVALLPHFHVEDRYYHWKGYYEAFRDADRVLVFPRTVKERFFDRIDADAAPVAGGGLDLAEYEPANLARCARLFSQAHRSERPFVLVLGRKAGGKRYPLILEAARLAAGAYDVVMIGPDEDRMPVDQPGVHCYGARPRDFVLGALASCACLANMSESESFGIVLLEAWAAGRPVVAQTRCLAFRDLVEPGVNGYLVESPAQLHGCIARYVAQPELAAAHGKAGGELARRYAWSELGACVRRILLEMAGNADLPAEATGCVARLRPFAAQAVAQTRAQLERGEIHDPDFNAFALMRDDPVSCVLDIGANRGQSLASLHTLFPQACIHSFEANPVFFEVLEAVAGALEPPAAVHRYGLGRGEATLDFYVPWAGNRPFLEECSTRADYYEKPWVAEKFARRGGLRLERIGVPIRRGDDLALDPQVVKIDVEGAELDVIVGLEATIRRARPVLLVENSDWHNVTALLERWGYRPFRYEPASRVLVPFHGTSTNTFYLHEVHHAMLAPQAATA
jgi:FkbM family methyltransferase